MARKPKDPSLRMTVDLRIPVTPGQKQLVNDAMAIDNREFAGWARALLLEAAEGLLDQPQRKRRASKTRARS
jgi:hypothetical protein